MLKRNYPPGKREGIKHQRLIAIAFRILPFLDRFPPSHARRTHSRSPHRNRLLNNFNLLLLLLLLLSSLKRTALLMRSIFIHILWIPFQNDKTFQDGGKREVFFRGEFGAFGISDEDWC